MCSRPGRSGNAVYMVSAGTATYRIYVTIGCTYKCVHQAHGGSAPADTSYIIQYTYNSNTKSFTGRQAG